MVAQALESLVAEIESSGRKLAAILLEPLQGEGGITPATSAFFQAVPASPPPVSIAPAG